MRSADGFPKPAADGIPATGDALSRKAGGIWIADWEWIVHALEEVVAARLVKLLRLAPFALSQPRSGSAAGIRLHRIPARQECGKVWFAIALEGFEAACIANVEAA